MTAAAVLLVAAVLASAASASSDLSFTTSTTTDLTSSSDFSGFDDAKGFAYYYWEDGDGVSKISIVRREGMELRLASSVVTHPADVSQDWYTNSITFARGRKFLVVAGVYAQDVRVFKVEDDGRDLEQKYRLPLTEDLCDTPEHAVVHPHHSDVIYVMCGDNYATTNILVLHINEEGELRVVQSRNFNANEYLANYAIHADGKTMFVAIDTGSAPPQFLTVHIDDDGRLGRHQVHYLNDRSGFMEPYAIASSGDFVFFPNWYGEQAGVYTYKLHREEDGLVTPQYVSFFPLENDDEYQYDIVAHPTLPVLYFDGEDGDVYAVRVDRHGQLRLIGKYETDVNDNAFLQLSHDGKFLYVSYRFSDGITGFHIDEHGALQRTATLYVADGSSYNYINGLAAV